MMADALPDRNQFDSQYAFFKAVFESGKGEQLPSCYKNDFAEFLRKYFANNDGIAASSTCHPNATEIRLPRKRRRLSEADFDFVPPPLQPHRTQQQQQSSRNFSRQRQVEDMSDIPNLPKDQTDVDLHLLDNKASQYPEFLDEEQLPPPQEARPRNTRNSFMTPSQSRSSRNIPAKTTANMPTAYNPFQVPKTSSSPQPKRQKMYAESDVPNNDEYGEAVRLPEWVQRGLRPDAQPPPQSGPIHKDDRASCEKNIANLRNALRKRRDEYNASRRRADECARRYKDTSRRLEMELTRLARISGKEENIQPVVGRQYRELDDLILLGGSHGHGGGRADAAVKPSVPAPKRKQRNVDRRDSSSEAYFKRRKRQRGVGDQSRVQQTWRQ